MGTVNSLNGWPGRSLRLASVLLRLVFIVQIVCVTSLVPILLILMLLYLVKVGNTTGVIAIAGVTTISFIYFLIKIGGPLHRRWIDEHGFSCMNCGKPAARFRILGSVPATEGMSDTFEFRCRLCGHVDLTLG